MDILDITRYLDLTLKPVPRRHPIPPGSVAYVEGATADIDAGVGSIYVISKNKQEIVIEAPPVEKVFIENAYERGLWRFKKHAHYLAVIEDLLPTIEFGTTNWAYLVPDQYEGYRIIHCQKVLQRVSCPTWAPMIGIDEIEITAWGTNSNRRGIWKGKEVDVICAWNDYDLWLVNRSMHGLRRVDGHDLTFDLYGHLVDRDGHVIGLVSEAAWGRQIGLGDEEFVRKELKRLEGIGCVYGAAEANSFLIAGDRLRLLQLQTICPYSDQDRLKKQAALSHDAGLDNLFDEFRSYGPYGYFRMLPHHLINKHEEMTYIRLNSSPHRPLSDCFLSSRDFKAFVVRAGLAIWCDDEDDTPYQTPKSASHPLVIRRRRPQKDVVRLVYNGRNKTNTLDESSEGAPKRSFKAISYSPNQFSTKSSHEVGPLRSSKALTYNVPLGSTSRFYHRPSTRLKKLTDTNSSQGTLEAEGC